MNAQKFIVPIITILLFCIPFFWFPLGVMDIGGDSTRLYFYDPLSYVKAQSFYGIIPSGIGGEAVSYYAIPYMFLLYVVKLFVQSPTILIGFFHGISLSCAFLFIYLIVKDILRNSIKIKNGYLEISSILSGLFYVFTPTLILGWDKEILTHSQVFLNPLIFFFLFRFVTRKNIRYLFGALLISFIFASNFTFVAAPPFFAFYPLALLFIFVYTKYILKRNISFKSVFFGLGLFILIHLFHLGPQVSNLFINGTQINQNVFSPEAKFDRGLSYFVASAQNIKTSYSLMNLPQLTQLTTISYGFIIFPVIVLLGFILVKNKTYLLIALFFFVTLFFVSANITQVGYLFYKSLFDIPGFSMFRNFFGQWVFVFTFFYSLLFGQAIYAIFGKIKKEYIVVISLLIFFILVINAWPFINGSLVNKVHFRSNNIKVPSAIDPEYEKVLHYISDLHTDGKFISIPLADPGYQMIMGTNGGAYQGPSTISYLLGKNDFTGYEGLVPFNETFLKLVRNNDIDGINRLFALLNIRYIFYNSDSRIYLDNFPDYPYTYVKDKMPRTQAEYKEFLQSLSVHKIKDFGENYHIYEVDNFLPRFYIATNYINSSDALTPFFVLNIEKSARSVVSTEKQDFLSETETIFSAENNSVLSLLLSNYHLHVHDPFISRRMDEYLYPLISLKEESTLESLKNNSTDYIDYSLLFLAKRVSELATFRDTPIVYKEFNRPKLWEVHRWKEYYSWEANLSRLEKQAKELIQWENNRDVTSEEKNFEKIKIKENFSQLELRLNRIIDNSKYTTEDKKYLKKSIKELFVELYSLIPIQIIDPSKVSYSLNLEHEFDGVYIPYLHSEKNDLLKSEDYSLKVNDVNVKSTQTNELSELATFDPVTLHAGKNDFFLTYSPSNLVNLFDWVGSGSVEIIDSRTAEITLDDELGNKSFLAQKVTDYKPKTQYLITFEYYIEGDPLLFNLFEKQGENGIFSSASYFNSVLSSNNWETKQYVITAASSATDGFIEFLPIDNTYNGKIYVKNLSVIKVPYNELLLRKEGEDIENFYVPKIQFKKINPTRYQVHVMNVNAPYTLVFSEAFNPNWNVYLSSNSSKEKNQNIYFSGDIQEAKEENIFFNFSFFNNGKLLKDIRHIRVNGYANAWRIAPDDVENKKDYYLTFVYQPQINFYYFFAISLVTFIFVVIALLFTFLKKNESH